MRRLAPKAMHQRTSPTDVRVYRSRRVGEARHLWVPSRGNSHDLQAVALDGDGDGDRVGADWEGATGTQSRSDAALAPSRRGVPRARKLNR